MSANKFATNQEVTLDGMFAIHIFSRLALDIGMILVKVYAFHPFSTQFSVLQ
jgi:hypothetical protein